MKISARNILKGTIVEIVKGATTSHVRIDIGGAVVTASITNEAVADLKLEKGKQAYAVSRHRMSWSALIEERACIRPRSAP